MCALTYLGAPNKSLLISYGALSGEMPGKATAGVEGLTVRPPVDKGQTRSRPSVGTALVLWITTCILARKALVSPSIHRLDSGKPDINSFSRLKLGFRPQLVDNFVDNKVFGFFVIFED